MSVEERIEKLEARVKELETWAFHVQIAQQQPRPVFQTIGSGRGEPIQLLSVQTAND